MKRFFPLVVSLSIMVAAALAAQTYLPFVSDKLENWFTRRQVIPIEGVQVRPVAWIVTIYGTGELRPSKQSDIISTIPGVLEEVRFKKGDAVVAGQAVASVRATELIARSKEVETVLKAAQLGEHEKENQLSEASKKLERVGELHNRDLIAAQDVRTAEADVAVARAQMELAQAQVGQQQAALEQLRYLLSFSKIVAPFTGVIIRRILNTGATVERAQAIMTLGAMETMQVTTEISARDVDLIQRGMPAQVTVRDLPGRIFAGQVVGLRSGPTGTASIMAEIQVTNSQKLLTAGMTASVSVPTKESRTVLLVPDKAVAQISGKANVGVLENSRIHERLITIGEHRGEMIEVINGLRAGEWIITDRQRKFPTNGRVSIVAEKTAPAR